MGSCPDTDIDVRAARRLILSNRELEKYTSAAFDVLWRRIKAGIPGPMLPARVANQITGFVSSCSLSEPAQPFALTKS